MAMITGTSTFNVGPKVPIRFKIDWLAFTVSASADFKDKDKFYLLKKLGYELSDFEEVAGKNFFNSGYSLGGGFVKLFYNDLSKPIQKGSSNYHNYIFTGVGCSDLHQKIDGNWIKLFAYLKKFGVSFRRIDIALDDLSYPPRISFDYIERKLARGEFRSSKRKYNIIQDKKTTGKPVGKSVYFGSRGGSGGGGSFGHTVLRIYQKALQLIFSKKQESSLPPEVLLQSTLPNFDGVYSWVRWEIEFTKAKAIAMIDLILEKSKSSENPIAESYYSVLRDTVDFLIPTKNKAGKIYKNKSKWRSSPKYLDFLNQAKSATLANPDKLYNLETVLDWVKYSVTPTLQLCNEIFSSKLGINFYDILKEFEMKNGSEYSKKQQRLLLESKFMDEDVLKFYLKHFLDSKGG